jgi:hypothetical protein
LRERRCRECDNESKPDQQSFYNRHGPSALRHPVSLALACVKTIIFY